MHSVTRSRSLWQGSLHGLYVWCLESELSFFPPLRGEVEMMQLQPGSWCPLSIPALCHSRTPQWNFWSQEQLLGDVCPRWLCVHPCLWMLLLQITCVLVRYILEPFGWYPNEGPCSASSFHHDLSPCMLMLLWHHQHIVLGVLLGNKLLPDQWVGLWQKHTWPLLWKRYTRVNKVWHCRRKHLGSSVNRWPSYVITYY